ncbi:MAG: trypsin-like peptidase domain-containing protein [Verrucomicrobiales bacterium]
MMRWFLFLVVLAGLEPLRGQLLEQPVAQVTPYDSVVRIEVATQTPDYRTPWNSGRFAGGIGTGFIIGKNRILTNAHVVSNARRVLVTQRGSSRKHPARVKFIAHDCDLALLEVEDFTPFEKFLHLELGEMPALESEVSAIGYPVGGDRLSVTRGVVSRIDFRPYSHSRADSHLVVQIDAAINPGNSGGPVVQGGKVVGVAFQGLTTADNTGYIIPTPVVRRFLKDVEDGRYDRYVDLGITSFPLFNPAMRKAYGLSQSERGVLVASVVPEGTCDGVLERGDILLKIAGYDIDNAGNIKVAGESLDMNEVVERKFAGDEVELVFLRGSEEKTAKVTLKGLPASRMYALRYDEQPRYFFYGGLVFQPLDFNLYATYKFKNQRVRSLFTDYVAKGIFKEREDIVVLTRVESDRLTTHFDGFKGMVLDEIDGVKVRSLKQVAELLSQENPPDYRELKFNGGARPLVLPSAEIEAAQERLMRRLSIPSPAYLGE